MRKLLLTALVLLPAISFGQSYVEPDGFMLYVFFAFAMMIPVLVIGSIYYQRRSARSVSRKRKPEVYLIGNKSLNPEVLTLFIANQTGKAIDLNSPVLEFKKFFKARKFKLKGPQGDKTYPFHLESGREHELQIKLDVFYKHDSSLSSYPKGRIVIESTAGQRYTSKCIRLQN